MRIWLSLLLLFFAGGVAKAQTGFVNIKEPYFKGKRLIVDLPPSQHHRNIGGSDGAGLCVYTSFWHSALWQSVRDVYGFRDWMAKRPGGSYPQKFDSTLSAFCKATKVKVPPYLQHTGGDESVLDLAMKTGRAVGVTYCGCDPNYGPNTVIGHMVSLVYLDSDWAAILDNNFVGQWLVMPRAEFLARWKGVKTDGTPYMGSDGIRKLPIGGGWAIILLDSPPAPYPTDPPVAVDENAPRIMIGQCPGGRCPLPAPSYIQSPCANGRCSPFSSQPSCPNGRCPLPAPVTPQTPEDESSEPVWVSSDNGNEWGCWKGKKCIARCFGDGRCEGVTQYGFANGVPINPPAPLPVGVAKEKVKLIGDKEVDKEPEFPEGGVDFGKLESEVKFWHSGRVCSRSDFFDALVGDAFTDDSEKWNLAVVGDAKFWTAVKGELTSLDTTTKGKLHCKFYLPTDWQVTQFSLTTGLVLRGPAVDRVGKELGEVKDTEFQVGSLKTLLAVRGGPLYVPPVDPPKSPVVPVTPNTPTPTPSDPTPTPAPLTPAPASNSPTPAILLGLGALYLILRRNN